MADQERRLLELVAASDDGSTEALLLAHGFALEVIVGVVRTGLATARAEPILAGGLAVEVSRVRITTPGGGHYWACKMAAHLDVPSSWVSVLMIAPGRKCS
jgi:hypothetical protein